MATFEEVELRDSIADELHIDRNLVGVSIGCNMIIIGISSKGNWITEERVNKAINKHKPGRLTSPVFKVML
jgi:hypothetical protein